VDFDLFGEMVVVLFGIWFMEYGIWNEAHLPFALKYRFHRN